MKKNLKLINLNLILNAILFLFLFITIQNSSQKMKVNFYFANSIPLPISFIVGTSFITGSLSFLVINLVMKWDKKNENHKEINN